MGSEGNNMNYQATILQFSKMLHNLSAILDKAAGSAVERNFEVGVLLQSRLAPDQFNFVRQVQITCDTAKSCAALLSGKDAPVHPDTEQTLLELKQRIDKTITYLATFQAKDFEGATERKISRPRWEGKVMRGEDFVLQHAIPNFFFHFTTAYSILRHSGVKIGKKDYLGELLFEKI
jgi:hypothetical protein